jgi:carnosine synthase
MKSALTASLAGAPAPLPQHKHDKKLGGSLDAAAFPCIPYADELDGVNTIEEELETLDEALASPHTIPVGSAPTGLIMPDGTQLVGAIAP